jgi:hypothetical protein
MNRTVRAICAFLSIAATLSILKGVALLASAGAATPLPVVVLPAVEVVAQPVAKTPIEFSAREPEAERL